MSVRILGTARNAGQTRLAGLTYAQRVLLNSPQAYYRLGEQVGPTMLDSSGNARHGLYSGSPTLQTPGLITNDTDTAATFGGSGVGTVAAAAWMAGWTSFTVIAWINPSGVTGNHDVVARDDLGSNGPWRLRLNANKAEFLLWHTAVTVLTGTTSLTAATRSHVACSYDGATMKVLVSGVVDNSVAATGALNSATPNLTIGAYGAGENFAGIIDEVQVFNTALPDATILADYRAGL